MKKFKSDTMEGEREFGTLREAVLKDMSTSYLLASWIRKTDEADPVDAIKDAYILLKICEERLKEVKS